MKRLIGLSLAVVLGTGAIGQSFYLGATGAFKSTWMFNKNISDQGGEQDYDPGFGYDAGGVIGYMFTEHFGAETGTFYSTFTQKYTGTIASTSYKGRNSLTQLDVPILLRFRADGGSYVTFGGLYSMINSAEHENDFGTVGESNSGDVSDKYSSSNFSGILGIGADFPLSDQFKLNLEMRFGYGFSDIKGVDAQGWDLNNQLIYPNSEKTWTAFGGLILGFKYEFGG